MHNNQILIFSWISMHENNDVEKKNWNHNIFYINDNIVRKTYATYKLKKFHVTFHDFRGLLQETIFFAKWFDFSELVFSRTKKQMTLF